MARAAGCRLPRGAEWTAALEQEIHGPAATGLNTYVAAQKPNLRDQTWAKQLAYKSGLQIAPGDELLVNSQLDPSGGSFWSIGDAMSEAYDDGFLWFTPVDEGAGTTFKNLIGNVGEMVYEDPGALDRVATTGLTAAAAEAAVSNQGALAVAGYSALSAPDGQLIRPASAGARLEHSDVGFRLAFSATDAGPKVESLAVTLGKVLETSRYLTPPTGP
jgi:hypothetical protein